MDVTDTSEKGRTKRRFEVKKRRGGEEGGGRAGRKSVDRREWEMLRAISTLVRA